MNKHFIIVSLVIAGVFVLGSSKVHAEKLVIEGNGSNSINGIVIDSGSVIETSQTNKAEIKNEINAQSNTGNNKINGSENGSIKTGDSNTNVKVTNILNSNISTVDCCIDKPTTSPKPQVILTPTSTPTGNPSSSTNTSSSDQSSSNPGSGTIIGGAPVLGLSDTSSDNEIQDNIVITASTLCLFAFAISARGIFRG